MNNKLLLTILLLALLHSCDNSNTTTTYYSDFEKPTIYPLSGIFTDTFEVSITTEEQATIYYTTDGTIPDTESLIYTSPILIDSTTVLKTKVISGDLESFTQTGIYIIPTEETNSVTNIILIIGDGMGPEQIKAAGYYLNGESGQLSFEEFPYYTDMSTYSADSTITDSAAAATAMATGNKVNNGVLSLDLPGSGDEHKTIMELAMDRGKMVGVVTTATTVHATPAAFLSHVSDRGSYSTIAGQYLEDSRPDVIFGGGSSSLSATEAISAGYNVVQNLEELEGIVYYSGEKYYGDFGSGYIPYMYDGLGDLPELSDMALKALDILEESQNGYFLVIECGRIDHAGHINDLTRNIYEVIELDDTVEKIISRISNRDDTIVLVTADHETGGLEVEENGGAGIIPNHSWSTTQHTSTRVPVYIWGTYAQDMAAEIDDNTDIFYTLLPY